MDYAQSIIVMLAGLIYIWGSIGSHFEDPRRDEFIVKLFTTILVIIGIITIIGGIKLWP